MTYALVFLAAAILTFVAIAISQPLLRSYALARPNGRSSHQKPTPQGGGIFVVGVTILIAASVTYWQFGYADETVRLTWTLAAAVLLTVCGALDDLRALPALPRLVVQAGAVALIVVTLPSEMRVISALPWWLERGLLFIGGIWFVNVVNFMDGVDWMTVVEVAPLTMALGLFGAAGALPPAGATLAFVLCGAMIGFAPFNRPVARLFLGDVGSLPVGLLLAWLLTLLAGNGHLAAAVILPLYYLADATITLLRRLIKREPITQAHRSHFYQRATDLGFTVPAIVRRVFAVNLILAVLALSTFVDSRWIAAAALLAAIVLVTGLLLAFSKPRFGALPPTQRSGSKTEA